MDSMLRRTWDRLGGSEAGSPFLPLAFRLFTSFGLLVLHACLPPEGRVPGPGEGLYLGLLAAFLLVSVVESARGLARTGNLFPTPSSLWTRVDLLLALALVALVVAFHGITREVFTPLFIFPVLASAFYLGSQGIVAVGVLSAGAHVVLVLAFSLGLLPPFGMSGEAFDTDPTRLTLVLGMAALQVLTVTLVVVLTRRNLERLRTDLSASKATMDELSALHQRVVESMHSGLLTLDAAGRITSANPAAEAILGRRPVPGEAVTTYLPVGADILRGPGGREARFEVAIFRPEAGRRILGGHLAPLRSAGGEETGHVLLFQDLTEFQVLQERARVTERMAAIGQLAAGLAHELRNPLASISGCVQLLQQAEAESALPRRVLGILSRESQRVEAIVKDFLEYARPTPPERVRVLLPRIVEEVRSSWEMDPRTEGLPLLVGAVPAVSFLADPTGLHRTLTNLLSNARKAVAGAPTPTVSLQSEVRDGSLRIDVSDSGCGMGPEELDRLFVPFSGGFQEGSGLGMSLVYAFVEAMGWQMEVHSAPGLGTQVSLVVPLEPENEGMALDLDKS